MVDILHRVGVDGPTPEKVYDALTTIDGLAGWWTTDTTGDAGVGGRIAFRFPPWTHVQLGSETHEIHYDWPIPDCAPPMEVMAAPRDRVALKLTTATPCADTFNVLLPEKTKGRKELSDL